MVYFSIDTMKAADDQDLDNLPNRYAQLFAGEMRSKLHLYGLGHTNSSIEVILHANDNYVGMSINGGNDEEQAALRRLYEDMKAGR